MIEMDCDKIAHCIAYDLETREIGLGTGEGGRSLDEIVSDAVSRMEHGSNEPELVRINHDIRSGLLQFLDDLRIAMQPILSREGK